MTCVLRQYRSELLLCALIAENVISPLADSCPLFGALLAALVLLLLLIGASYMVHNRVVQFVGFPRSLQNLLPEAEPSSYSRLLFCRVNRSSAFAPSPSRLSLRQMLVR